LIFISFKQAESCGNFFVATSS